MLNKQTNRILGTWSHGKRCDALIIGIPKGEERGDGAEKCTDFPQVHRQLSGGKTAIQQIVPS